MFAISIQMTHRTVKAVTVKAITVKTITMQTALASRFRFSLAIVLVMSLLQHSKADQNSARPNKKPASVSAFVTRYCIACHDADSAEGGLDFNSLTADFGESQSAQKWIEVLDRINLGEMPPEDEPRPSAQELAEVTDWITDQIRSQHDAAASTGGKVVMRRMTRLEYARTVSDLFSIRFIDGQGPLEKLPPDGAIKGFDRHAKALMIDPSLMDAYLRVADAIARQAIRFRPPLVQEKTMHYDFRHTRDSAMSYIVKGRQATIDQGRMILMEGQARTFGVLRHPHDGREIPETGRYRVRVRAGASRAGASRAGASRGQSSDPIFMRIKQGAGETIAQFRVDASSDKMHVYETEVTRSSSLQGEFDVEMVGGTGFHPYVHYRGELSRKADQAFREGDVAQSLRIKARLRAQGDFDVGVRSRYARETADLEDLPKLHLDWIEVTGPLRDPFPPPNMRLMFPDGWDVNEAGKSQEEVLAKQLQLTRSALTRLLPRAYRRRVTANEIESFVDLTRRELDQGNDFQSALRTTVVAMLCSPHFLFLHEPSDQLAATSNRDTVHDLATSTRPLSSFELATRISYFLWSSKPDDELMLHAAQGDLLQDIVLEKQINRMLDDPRIEGFIQGFVRQWLRVEEFNRFAPDERIFPRFHETRFAGVERDFEEQPLAMVREILRRDLPVTDLLDSDWTMLNQRLAEYYELDGSTSTAKGTAENQGPRADLPSGNEFIPVSLSGDQRIRRGGILGMAGFHRWGSDGSRTKPVERGKYILDVLFNDPPPPPPPNAGEVEPNLQGQKLTVRERLAKHREQTTCQNCHRRIDPYGLALENFNTVGRWREYEDGEKPIRHWGEDRPPVDPSGRLMTGAQFDTFAEFKTVLRRQQDRFIRGLSEKLLSYSLARSVAPGDRVLLDAIVQRCKEDGNSLRTMLGLIIQSKTFRSK